jgi:hypothetical protein
MATISASYDQSAWSTRILSSIAGIVATDDRSMASLSDHPATVETSSCGSTLVVS